MVCNKINEFLLELGDDALVVLYVKYEGVKIRRGRGEGGGLFCTRYTHIHMKRHQAIGSLPMNFLIGL